MAGHPQNSPRGLWAKKAGMVGSDGLKFTPYSTTTALLTGNSTGLVSAGGLMVSGKTGQKITANSTAIIASALAIGSLASYITANSTGIKIGSRYISTNTTGNATT